MDESYLMAAVRYIERNPVAAGLCSRAQDWIWSSSRAHLLGENDLLVRVKPMLQRIGDWNEYLSDSKDAEELPEQISLHSRTGRPLGSEQFVAMLEDISGRELLSKRPGRPATDRQK